MSDNPYKQYNDAELLNRYRKLSDDFVTFIHIPRLEGKVIPFDKSQKEALKIDKLIAECVNRGLMDLTESLTDKGRRVKFYTPSAESS